MPFSSRPAAASGHGNGRRVFRNFSDFRKVPGNGRGRQTPPPDATSAESYYYVKQMNARTPMVIVMTDGEEIRGCIEWYDRNCLKVNRESGPNLLIQKHCIKYLFKEEEA